ncbi:MAG TPA: glycosyltransferase, partial [Chloroflexota bacterium]
EAARHVGPFRAFRTHLRQAFHDYSGPYVNIDVLLSWATERFGAVSVPHHVRRSGKSSYGFGKLLRHAFNMITGFSSLPLQLASFVGFVFTVFGGVILVMVVTRALVQGVTVPGFPFLASIIAIFSGAQMFALGMIGEYLSRMHFKLMEMPSYTVREAVEHESAEASHG